MRHVDRMNDDERLNLTASSILALMDQDQELAKARAWARRNYYERLRVAVRGAGLDSSDAAELIRLIDEAQARA